MDESYMEYFYTNLNQDICSLANNIFTDVSTCDDLFLGTLRYGMKAVSSRYFDLLRYMGYIKYKGLKSYDFLNSQEFGEISNNYYFY